MGLRVPLPAGPRGWQGWQQGLCSGLCHCVCLLGGGTQPAIGVSLPFPAFWGQE